MAKIDESLHAAPNVTPYVWEAYSPGDKPSELGILIGCECPPLAEDDVPFSTIGFEAAFRTGAQPDDVHVFINKRDASVRMKARSLRESVCPHSEITIEPGEAFVWFHKRVHAFNVFESGLKETIQFETMVIGRERLDGSVDIMQVWPSGETMGFNSYAAAMEAK